MKLILPPMISMIMDRRGIRAKGQKEIEEKHRQQYRAAVTARDRACSRLKSGLATSQQRRPMTPVKDAEVYARNTHMGWINPDLANEILQSDDTRRTPWITHTSTNTQGLVDRRRGRVLPLAPTQTNPLPAQPAGLRAAAGHSDGKRVATSKRAFSTWPSPCQCRSRVNCILEWSILSAR